MSLRHVVPIIVLGGIVATIGLVLVFNRAHAPATSLETGLQGLASCFTRGVGTEDDASIACLHPRIKSLLKTHSAANIMSALDSSTTPESVARSCHVIGHIVGRNVYTNEGSIEPAFAACSESCYSACVHGVTTAAIEAELGEAVDANLAHFSMDKLRMTALPYCKKSAALCHAVGHLLRIQAGSYEQALPVCDGMGLWRHECASGVFMEDAGATETTIRGSAETAPTYTSYTEPCSSVSSEYQSACFRYLYLYQNRLFVRDHITEKAFQIELSRHACDTLSGSARAHCYFGLGGAAKRITYGTEDGTNEFCESLPSQSDQHVCMNGLLERPIDSNR